MTPRIAWLLRGALLTIPYIALLVLGGLWLWQQGRVLLFVGVSAGLALLALVLQRLAQRKPAKPAASRRFELQAELPALHWSPLGQQAWSDLQKYAAEIDTEQFAWEDPREWWKLFHDTVGRVAAAFHARSGEPMLEVPVPQILRIVELVARDLRRAIATQVPGSHVMTVNDYRRIKAVADWIPALSRLYRLGSFLINPAAGVAREVANFAQQRVIESSTSEIKRWLLGFLVRQTGFYAIELYSGQMAFDPELTAPDAKASGGTEASSAVPSAVAPNRSASVGTPTDTSTTSEPPPRILILGQVKAGKSSLINALFGEVRAVSDVLPATQGITEYRLEQPSADGKGSAACGVLLDSPGYDDVTLGEQGRALIRREVPRCDLVILVVAATSAARASDRTMLDEIRQEFAAHPERIPPVFMVALSHVDLLRPFNEWSPPYDIAKPGSTKARNIRDAVDSVAGDLSLDPADVVPVCLRPDRIDNVQEGLIPQLAERLPAARRSACLRIFRQRQSEQAWSLWRIQAESAGRILVRLGKHAASLAVEEARAAADNYLTKSRSKKD